jgi:hypothetical protein
MSVEKTQPKRKYASPTLKKLALEKTQLLLESQTAEGDKDAKDLLDLLTLAPEET